MTDDAKLLALTADLVSAHVRGNSVEGSALPNLIRSVYATLATADSQPTPVEARPEPPVPIRKSIQREYLVCLEDGVHVKMLKRYLATRYKLTVAQYREKWGLPADYPMVAPAYAEKRSALAKSFGLGQKRAGPAKEPEAEVVAEPPTATPKRAPRQAGKTKKAA